MGRWKTGPKPASVRESIKPPAWPAGRVTRTLVPIDLSQDRGGALGQQIIGHCYAQLLCSLRGGGRFGAQYLGSIGSTNQATQTQLAVIQVLSEAGNRHLATPIQAQVHRPLGDNAASSQRMVTRLQQLKHLAIGTAQFYTHRALAAGGQ
jgi:hypothetical protein